MIQGCRCWRRCWPIKSWSRWRLWRFCLQCCLRRSLSRRLIIRNRRFWLIQRFRWWIIQPRGCFITRWSILGPWQLMLGRPWFPSGLRRRWLACTWLIWKVSASQGQIRSFTFRSSIGPCSTVVLGWKILGSTWLIRRWRPWWPGWLLITRWSSCHRRPWRRCSRHWRLLLILLSRLSGLRQRLSRLGLQLKIPGRILIGLQWRPFWLIGSIRWW